MRGILKFVCSASFCAALVGGVAPSAVRADELPVTDKVPASMTKIRVMTYNGAYTSLPARIAAGLGFYAKYNLDAELVVVNSGPAGVAALLCGSLDFIEPPTDQIIQNQLKGTDLKIVVGNEVKNFYNLIVANSVPLPNAAAGYPAVVRDLKGKRIGVNALGASTHLMMNALLKGAGLSPDDVTPHSPRGRPTASMPIWASHPFPRSSPRSAPAARRSISATGKAPRCCRSWVAPSKASRPKPPTFASIPTS